MYSKLVLSKLLLRQLTQFFTLLNDPEDDKISQRSHKRLTCYLEQEMEWQISTICLRVVCLSACLQLPPTPYSRPTIGKLRNKKKIYVTASSSLVSSPSLIRNECTLYSEYPNKYYCRQSTKICSSLHAQTTGKSLLTLTTIISYCPHYRFRLLSCTTIILKINQRHRRWFNFNIAPCAQWNTNG